MHTEKDNAYKKIIERFEDRVGKGYNESAILHALVELIEYLDEKEKIE